MAMGTIRGFTTMRCMACHDPAIKDGIVPITNGFQQPEYAMCKNCYASILKSNVILLENNTDTIYKIFMEAIERDQLHTRTN